MINREIGEVVPYQFKVEGRKFEAETKRRIGIGRFEATVQSVYEVSSNPDKTDTVLRKPVGTVLTSGKSRERVLGVAQTYVEKQKSGK